MESALIVSPSEKDTDFFTKLFNGTSIRRTAALGSAGEARRLLLERDFDLVIIDAPLQDETGERLSRHIASKGISQVILAAKRESSDAAAAVCETGGVLTIAKPVNKAVFGSALSLAESAQNRIRRMRAENAGFNQKMEDIRVVGRAKCILMSHINMSEQEAHRYIEKQAMDMRATKRAIAEGILKTYEN